MLVNHLRKLVVRLTDLAQIDPEDIIHSFQSIGITEAGRSRLFASNAATNLTPYISKYAAQQDIPKFEIPQDGIEADTVYTVLRDELNLDGKPTLNLAR